MTEAQGHPIHFQTAQPVTRFVPDYVAPQPGETDSLDRIWACLKETTDVLEAEALLHVDMFPDPGWVSDLLARIRDRRQHLQMVEQMVEQRAVEVLG